MTKPTMKRIDTEKWVVVRARCVGCGHERDIQAGEVAPNDVPMCERCFMPMIAAHARAKRRTDR